MISCKVPAKQDTTIGDYRFLIAEQMFHSALNQRFFKISRNKNPPFFSCVSSSENLVHPVKAYIMTAHCQERGTLQALEQMLTEVGHCGPSIEEYHDYVHLRASPECSCGVNFGTMLFVAQYCYL